MSTLKSVIGDVKASMGIFDGRDSGLYGLLAEFRNPGALYEAAGAVRKAGYRRFDVHSPFPIHGMDRAMGLGNSRVGWFTLLGGASGLALGVWLQWWTGSVDYPLNISGKPFFAVEPSIPIIFELTILFSAIAAVTAMFAMNGLPRPYNPLFYSDRFARATDDGFFLHVAASDPRFSLEGTERLLRELGATHVEILHDRGTADGHDA
jgi:hypothetical protein